MKIEETPLKGLYLLQPEVYEDSRGYFLESWNEQKLAASGLNAHFVQDNESKSTFGVIRGLHYQLSPWSQAKLVRVIEGRVLDVVLDIRAKSPTYGKHFSIELNSENKFQLYIPHGFAHGFAVLSEVAIFAYKCDQYYAPEFEAGILATDSTLMIDWGIAKEKMILSKKDLLYPVFGMHKSIEV
jgi:dTDP-4-dehydrorhamnose 3,5-epimerase